MLLLSKSQQILVERRRRNEKKQLDALFKFKFTTVKVSGYASKQQVERVCKINWMKNRKSQVCNFQNKIYFKYKL